MKKIRRLFILVVLLANIFIIALPIIKKFLDDGIMIEVSTKQENGLLPPAISVCRRSSDLYVFFDFSLHDQSSSCRYYFKDGWKNYKQCMNKSEIG